jgi:hypothetical protein
MSFIQNISSDNITVKYLNVSYINGLSASYNDCGCDCDCDDECCHESRFFCCTGNNSQPSDIPGPTGPTGPIGISPSSIYTNTLFVNTDEQTTINPTFNSITYNAPTSSGTLITNGFVSGVPLPIKTQFTSTDPTGIQFASVPGVITFPFIPTSSWLLHAWFSTNVQYPDTMQVYWQLFKNNSDNLYNPILVSNSLYVNITGNTQTNYIITNNIERTEFDGNTNQILAKIVAVYTDNGGGTINPSLSGYLSPSTGVVNYLSVSIVGPTGPPGSGVAYTGPTGPTGLSLTGPKGDSYTGPTGPMGLNGDSYTGPTGPMGLNGDSYTGPTGPIGLSLTGPTGPIGSKGDSYTGPTGPIGLSLTGPTGPMGLNGDSYTGPTGSTGLSLTGPTGSKGDSYTGPTGPIGLSLTGPTGSKGDSYTGPTGPIGLSLTGPTGPMGLNGDSYTGPTGPIGLSLTGPTGPPGTGIAYTGPTGPPGSSNLNAIDTNISGIYYPTFIDGTGSINTVKIDLTGLTYNPATNVMAFTAPPTSTVDATGPSQLLRWDNFSNNTYTPTLRDDLGNNLNSLSYVQRVGQYCRIGNTVFFQFRIQISSKSGLGNSLNKIQITLPALASLENALFQSFTISNIFNTSTSIVCIGGQIPSGGVNYCNFPIKTSSSTSTTELTVGDISTTFQIRGGGFYFAQ